MQRLWPAIAGWLAGAAAATPVTSRPSPTGPVPWTAPALPRADSHHGTRRVGHHAGGHAAEQRPDEPRLAMGAHHDHLGVTPTRRPEDLLAALRSVIAPGTTVLLTEAPLTSGGAGKKMTVLASK